MKRLLLFLLLFCAGASLALGQIPRTISFQGVLTDAAGVLRPDGPVTLTLSIYADPTGGVPLYSETFTATIVRGVFNVVIGGGDIAGIPETMEFDRRYWLGVRVGNDAEMTPRSEFTSVPYALNAARAVIASRAMLADSSVNAMRAVSADTATRVREGVVTSVNGQTGAIELAGAGATLVTRSGNTLTISSGDPTGIRRIDNYDGSMVIDPPQGPFITMHVREGGVQAHHYRDLSIANEKIMSNAVDAAKLNTRGASPRTSLMSVGAPTPAWLNPIHVNLAYHDVLASDSILWFLTNAGRGGGGRFSLASPQTSAIALEGTTAGPGIAIHGEATQGVALRAATSTGTAVDAISNDRGVAIAGRSRNGAVAILTNSNPANSTPVLTARTNGQGAAGAFHADDPSSMASAVVATTASANGSAGLFLNDAGGTALSANNVGTNRAPAIFALRAPFPGPGPTSFVPDMSSWQAAVDGLDLWGSGIGVAGRAPHGIGVFGTTVDGEAAVKGVSTGEAPAAIFVGDVIIDGATTITKSLTIDGMVHITNPTNAVTKDDGALVVEGGLGVGRDLVVGGKFGSAEVATSGNGTIGGTLDVTGNLVAHRNLDVTGSLTSSAMLVSGSAPGHIATFENRSTTTGDGIAIRVLNADAGDQNNFVTFYSGTGTTHVAGRIEGYQHAGNQYLTAVKEIIDGTSGGTSLWQAGVTYLTSTLLNPSTFFGPDGLIDFNRDAIRLVPGTPPVINFHKPTLSGGGLTYDEWGLPNGIALPDVNMDPPTIDISFPTIEVGNPFTLRTPARITEELPQVFKNLVCKAIDDDWKSLLQTDLVSLSTAVVRMEIESACKDGGVTYGSKGADYAEWMPKAVPTDRFLYGQIIGVRNGRISLRTADADQIMCVSMAPVVIGNVPPAGSEGEYEKVVFVGQVPVMVRGIVDAGDFIVASGRGDGLGYGVGTDELTVDDLPGVLGRALTSSSQAYGVVTVLVGLQSGDVATIVKSQDARIRELEEKLDTLIELRSASPTSEDSRLR